jgi:hypothetical protein
MHALRLFGFTLGLATATGAASAACAQQAPRPAPAARAQQRALPPTGNSPQASRPAPAARAVYIVRAGVIRWSDNRSEVALFGANYTLPSASDYRAAGYLRLDRKRLVDEDMAQFARMGWDALRLSFWGDWENADRAGNLVANDHLDLQDYLIAKARERASHPAQPDYHLRRAGRIICGHRAARLLATTTAASWAQPRGLARR